MRHKLRLPRPTRATLAVTAVVGLLVSTPSLASATTGTALLRMSDTIFCISVMSPPGVLSCRMTTSASLLWT